MANRYWVGGTAIVGWYGGNKMGSYFWGAGGQAIPTIADGCVSRCGLRCQHCNDCQWQHWSKKYQLYGIHRHAYWHSQHNGVWQHIHLLRA
jgi:hypothetical protein